MNNILLIISTGSIIPLLVAGTEQEIINYFLGSYYTGEKVVSVEFITNFYKELI